jgi:serine/threonine protein kinase
MPPASPFSLTEFDSEAPPRIRISSEVIQKIMHLKDTVLANTQARFPHDMIERLCEVVECLSPGGKYIYKKNRIVAPPLEGDKMGVCFPSSFVVVKTEQLAYGCIFTGERLGVGGQSHVNSAVLFIFKQRVSQDLEFAEMQEVVKHTTRVKSMHEVSPQRFRSQQTAYRCPSVAAPYIYGTYSGVTGMKILQVFKRYRGDLEAYMRSLPTHVEFSRIALKKVAIQLGTALEACHAQGVIHRDMKIENVLANWGPAGLEEVVLADLGSCCHQDDLCLKTQLIGSLRYFAPEVAARHPDLHFRDLYAGVGVQDPVDLVGSAVDMWGYGLILYFLAMRQLPTFSIHLKEISALFRMIQNPRSLPEVKLAHEQLLQQKLHVWQQTTRQQLVREFDLQDPLAEAPSMDEFILRCLRIDPRQRPTREQLSQFIRQ